MWWGQFTVLILLVAKVVSFFFRVSMHEEVGSRKTLQQIWRCYDLHFVLKVSDMK